MTCAADGLCKELANKLAELEALLKESGEYRGPVVTATREVMCERRMVPKPESFRDLQRECGAIAKEKGWDEDPVDSLLATLLDGRMPADRELDAAYSRHRANKLMVDSMLQVTEIAEAAEEIRTGRIETRIREDGKPEGYWSEKADVVIRLGHEAAKEGVDLQSEIELKNAYNRSREHRHGGKVL